MDKSASPFNLVSLTELLKYDLNDHKVEKILSAVAIETGREHKIWLMYIYSEIHLRPRQQYMESGKGV